MVGARTPDPFTPDEVDEAFETFEVIDLRADVDGTIHLDDQPPVSVAQVNEQVGQRLSPTPAAVVAAMLYAAAVYEDGVLVPVRAKDASGTAWLVLRASSKPALKDADGVPTFQSVPRARVLTLLDEADLERLGEQGDVDGPKAEAAAAPEPAPAPAPAPQPSPAPRPAPVPVVEFDDDDDEPVAVTPPAGVINDEDDEPVAPPVRVQPVEAAAPVVVPVVQPDPAPVPEVAAPEVVVQPEPVPEPETSPVPVSPTPAPVVVQPAPGSPAQAPAQGGGPAWKPLRQAEDPTPVPDPFWDQVTPAPEADPEPEPAPVSPTQMPQAAWPTPVTQPQAPTPAQAPNPLAGMTAEQLAALIASGQAPAPQQPEPDDDKKTGRMGLGALGRSKPTQKPSRPRKEPKPASKGGVSRRTVLIGGGLVVLAGAGLLGRKMVHLPAAAPSQEATSQAAASLPPRPSGGSVPLPVKTAPATLADKATWMVAVKEQTAPVPLEDGVLVLTPDGKLTSVDEDGKTVSTVDVPGDARTVSVGGGRAWVESAGKITHFSLDSLNLGGSTAVDVPDGATVSWSGGCPLVTLGEGRAAGVDAQGLFEVTVPSGFVATAADMGQVLMMDGAARYQTANREGKNGEGRATGPDGAPLVLIRTLSAHQVALGWGEDQLTVTSTDDGKTVCQTGGVGLASMGALDPIQVPASQVWLLGQTVIDLAAAKITVTRMEPVTFDRAWLYGQDPSGWKATPASEINADPIPLEGAALAVPWGGSKTLSYVVDTDAGAWGCYALSHQA